MIIWIDVDDTVADLITEWVRRYNADWNDTLTPADFTDWDCSMIVKPECGLGFYDYLLDDDLYHDVQPIAGALDAVRYLRLHHQVGFATSCGGNPARYAASAGAKLEWLMHHGFLTDPNEYAALSDKTHLRGDVLIDDKLSTVNRWHGVALMPAQAHNAKGSVAAHVTRCNDWAQIVWNIDHFTRCDQW